MSRVADIVTTCEELYEDLEFSACRAWKEEAPGRHAIGYLPMWVPREIIHAAGMLPVGILGGGDKLEIIRGDAFFQSYICHLPRSVIELVLKGNLDFLDGCLFPSICDIVRNLSGMWQLLRPDTYVRYVDVPQNFEPDRGGRFFRTELRKLIDDLGGIAGRPVTDDALKHSIELYDENRRLIRGLYGRRSAVPWLVPTSEVYLVQRAGMVLPVEAHNDLVREYLAAAEMDDRPERDNSRVVVSGAFCEQPPLDLIRTLERAGCYVVDDDFMLVNRWFAQDVARPGDPVDALVTAFLEQGIANPARYEPHAGTKGQDLIECVRRRDADGIIFAAPSFCDPALLERPMLQKAVEAAGIPSTAFKYSENTGQLQPIREQAGTFSDSVKLWSSV